MEKNVKENLFMQSSAEDTEMNDFALEKRINELNNLIRNQRKIIRILNPTLLVLLSLILVICAIISNQLFIAVGIISVPTTIIIGIIEKIIIKKNIIKKEECQKGLKLKEQRLEKINQRTNLLSKDNDVLAIREELINKSTKEHTFDSSDYFIKSYLIDKRVKEKTKDIPKIKKKTRQKKILEYRI